MDTTAFEADGTTPADTVRVSKGNTFTYELNSKADAYCIQGTNTKASHDWAYISSKGGLQDAGTTCPTDLTTF